MELSFPGCGLKIDFSNWESGGRLSSLCTGTSLLYRPEAVDFESIDMVSRFIGATINRSCGNVKNAPVSKVFSEYCDLLGVIYRRGLNTGWTESELQGLKESLKKFKDYFGSTDKGYRASGTETFTLNCPKHLVDSFRAVGGAENFHGGHYESVHKIFKRAYQRTSK